MNMNRLILKYQLKSGMLQKNQNFVLQMQNSFDYFAMQSSPYICNQFNDFCCLNNKNRDIRK